MKLANQDQVGPAVLTDLVTSASIDTYTRNGTPQVDVLGQNVRESYGALGFSTVAHLKTAGSSLPGIAAGFWRAVYFRLDALPASAGYLLAQSNATNAGWQMWVGGPGASYALTFRIVDGSGAFKNASTVAMSAGDLGQQLLFVGVWDGAMLHAYVRRAEIGSPGAVTGYTPSPNALTVGVSDPSGTSPLLTGAIFGWGGGDVAGGATQAEVFALFDAVAATGRIQPIPGKTDHWSDLTQDILANGGPINGIPATVLDRVGTDHLTRVGSGLQVLNGGLTGFSPSQFLRTESSVTLLNTTQWFVAMDVLLGDFGSDGLTHYLMAKSNNTTQGVELRINNGGVLDVAYGTGSARSAVTSITLQATEKSSRIRILLQYDSTGTVTTLYAGGAARTATSSSVVCAAATASPLTVGVFGVNGSNHNDKVIVYGIQCGNAIPTTAERDALLADTTFAAIAGKTTFRHWFPDDIAAAGGAVPTTTKDRVGTINLVRVNAPLQVAQRVDRPWSLEVNPILMGATSFADTSYYATANDALPGSAAGFAVSALIQVNSQAVPSVVRRVFAARSDDTYGWEILLSGTHTLLSSTAYNGTTGYNAPSYSITAADVGKLLLVTMVWDPIGLYTRLYVKRAEVGSGTAITGSFAPKTGCPAIIGNKIGMSRPFDATGTVFGVQYAVGVPTLSQIQAHHDAVMAQERMVQIPGMLGTVIDISRDANDAGGSLPMTLKDREGSANFYAQGSPTVARQYTRTWGW